MIQVLLFIRNNWKLILMLCSIGISFWSGWHIKSKLDKEAQQEAILQAIKDEQSRAAVFETTQSNVLNTIHDLTEKMQEENAKNPNHCLISAASLHLIQRANR